MARATICAHILFDASLLKSRNISGKLEPGHNEPADHAFVMHRFNTAKCHLIIFHSHSLLLYTHSKLTFCYFYANMLNAGEV